MNRLTKLALAGTLMAVSAASLASIKTAQVRANNWTGAATAAYVPLNASGVTTITFYLSAPTRLIVNYSAECAVAAPEGNTDAYLDIDLVVNGSPLAPTAGNQDAFCSSNGTVGADGWTRGSISIFFNGVTGRNTIRVQARGNSGATSIWLGDSSLIVHD
jgi:hypothetical protein